MGLLYGYGHSDEYCMHNVDCLQVLVCRVREKEERTCSTAIVCKVFLDENCLPRICATFYSKNIKIYCLLLSI